MDEDRVATVKNAGPNGCECQETRGGQRVGVGVGVKEMHSRRLFGIYI